MKQEYNRIKLKLYFAISVFLLTTTFSKGQTNFNKLKTDSLLDVLCTNNKFMGSVAISINGCAIYNRACGIAEMSNNSSKLSTTETEYRIGSTSKIFTSVMIFQLIEENKLAQETKLSEFFPEIPNSNLISISNLLNHRSGIYDYVNNNYADYLTWRTKPKSHSEIIKIISSGKPRFKPNKKAGYSNSNYLLLGYIIEKLTGKDYATNLKERIADKIGLRNTHCGNDTTTKPSECFSYMYVIDKWIQVDQTNLSIPGGAGAIISTTNDLTAFITALFNGKLISGNSLNEMTSIKDDYGKGIEKFTFDSKSAFGHTGALDEFRSRLYYFPEDSISIAICSNGFEYPLSWVMKGIENIYHNKEYLIPTFKEFKIGLDTLSKYEGIYKHWIIPLKVIVKIKDNKLTLSQELFGNPQPDPPNIYAINSHEFYNYKENIRFFFNIEKKREKLIVYQGAGSMKFKRKR